MPEKDSQQLQELMIGPQAQQVQLGYHENALEPSAEQKKLVLGPGKYQQLREVK